MKYARAAVGGTFDHFHIGHRQLLETVLESVHKVIIGITTKQLIQDKVAKNLIEPVNVRTNNVVSYLKQHQLANRVEIMELNDPFGPTISDPTIDVLIVSKMTAAGAELVNRERSTRGLKLLPVIMTPMVLDQNGHYISSTEIREGRINRQGKVYKKLFEQDIILDQNRLNQLKSPKGEEFDQEALKSATKTFIIGDMVTQHFIINRLPFDVAIVDGKNKRKPVTFSYPHLKSLLLTNPAGTISSRVANALINTFAESIPGTVVKVGGEEDLLAFVACLAGPLQSLVLYGQPEGGIVMISLSEALKNQQAQFLSPEFNR